jgi:hypothetical protein
MNEKQKRLTIIAAIAFVIIGFGTLFDLDNSYTEIVERRLLQGLFLWFMLAVVYTALFFVFKTPKE